MQLLPQPETADENQFHTPKFISQKSKKCWNEN